jgi:hypothetical protein
MSKIGEDKVLQPGDSPLDNDKYWDESVEEDRISDDEAIVVSGELEVGRNGHPVTIKVIDEVTGAQMEVNHVVNGLFMIEDQRGETNGWLSVAMGSIERLSEVIGLISRATLEELKRLFRLDKESVD